MWKSFQAARPSSAFSVSFPRCGIIALPVRTDEGIGGGCAIVVGWGGLRGGGGGGGGEGGEGGRGGGVDFVEGRRV